MPRTPTAVRRPRARRGDGELLRTEILAAAERLLAATGDEDAVSIRAIADAVGVTPPSIYLHFPDKDALITAVCEARFRDFDERLEAAAARASDPLESMRLRARAYLDFGREHPEHYRILFMTRSTHGHGVADTGGEVGGAAFQHLVAAVQACMDAGIFTARDPQATAITVWAAMHGLTSLLISRPGFPWPHVDDLVHEVLDVHERGLLSPRARKV